jgi:hypothetical protein
MGITPATPPTSCVGLTGAGLWQHLRELRRHQNVDAGGRKLTALSAECSLSDTNFFYESNHMQIRSFFCASLLVLSLTGCGKPEPPPPSSQLAEVTKERDRERAARIEAEAARQKAESHNTILMFGAALGCAVALFAGIALGSSARRRSFPRTGLQRGQADE